MYIKDGVIKSQNQIVVIKDGKQYLNPSKELLESDGWIEKTCNITEEEQAQLELEYEKEQVKALIKAYDESSAVNEFYYKGYPIWLDKSTRVGLLLRFQSEQSLGKDETNLWYNGVKFTLSVTEAIQLLCFLENYASACYDTTQAHISAVDSLDNIEAVKAYNYTINYPEKLNL